MLRLQLVQNKDGSAQSPLCVCTWCCCCCFSLPPLEQVRVVLPCSITWHWGQKRSCFVTSLQEQNSRSKTALKKSNLLSFNLTECNKTGSGGSELLPLPSSRHCSPAASLQGSTGHQGMLVLLFPSMQTGYRADPASLQV